MSNRRIVVVGAGMGGLSAAHWLNKRGYDVEVLEASDRSGGRMQLLERRGDFVDVGAQFFHSSYSGALEFMDELGLAARRRVISAGLIPGFSGWVDDVALVRHGWGTALYPPGQYQAVIDFRNRAEALEGLSFVGSAYGGTHMEAAILTARSAVSRVERG